MKKFLILLILGCLCFTGCEDKKPKEKVSVVHLAPTNETTVSPTPSASKDETPTPEPTSTPTPAPTNTPTPTEKPALPTATSTPTPTVTDIPIVDEKMNLPDLINQYRATNGKNPLKEEESFSLCAAVRLAEMSGTGLSHTRPDGTSFGTVFATYNVSGEEAIELAYESKQMSTAKAFQAFSVSKENQAALLGDWTGIGVAMDGTRAVLLLIR